MPGMISQAQGAPGVSGRQVSTVPQQTPQHPPQGQPPQPQAAPDVAGGPGGEIQTMYDTVVGQSAEYIYGEGLQNVQQRLQVSEDPAEDIGAVVGGVLAMNLQGAREQKKMIPPPIIIQAGMELSYLVAELAVQLGRMAPEELDREAVEGFYVAITTFGQASKKLLKPDESKAYQQIIQALVAAEQKKHQQPGASSQSPAGNVPPQPQGAM